MSNSSNRFSEVTVIVCFGILIVIGLLYLVLVGGGAIFGDFESNMVEVEMSDPPEMEFRSGGDSSTTTLD